MKTTETMSIVFMFAILIFGGLLFIVDVLTFVDLLQFFILFGILYGIDDIRKKLEDK